MCFAFGYGDEGKVLSTTLLSVQSTVKPKQESNSNKRKTKEY